MGRALPLALLLSALVAARAALTPREEVLVNAPRPERLRTALYGLTRRDHLMASEGDHETARLVQSELEMADHHCLLPANPDTMAIGVHSDSLASVADTKAEYAKSKLMLYVLQRLLDSSVYQRVSKRLFLLWSQLKRIFRGGGCLSCI